MGSVSSISGLQGAVSNKAVLDEVILDLSTVGLSAALSGMFGVDEEAFKVHPESASASPDIAVINGFLRRALVTALVEQNIRISERMQSGLVPFSVSACSSFKLPGRVVGATSQVRILNGCCEGEGFRRELGVPRASFSAKCVNLRSKFAR
jgi:hypothetical protein